MSATGPTESESEWLSLVRYQLALAREQVAAPPPLSSLSINMLQDAVESLMALATEHLKTPLPNNPDFLAIFDGVTKRLEPNSAIPGHRPAMVALNKARVNFKHYGNSPAEPTIRRHVDRAGEFAEALTSEVFGISLADVSLLQFVRCVEARDHLARAQQLWPTSPRDAAEALRLAYNALVSDFVQRKSWNPGKTLFNTRPSSVPSRIDIQRLGRVSEKFGEWLENLDEWVRGLALGVDMRQYAFFDAHMPRITNMSSGRFITHHRDEISITDDIFNRCFKFVLDTALSFGADDFDFDHWAARQALRRAQEQATPENS